MINSISPNNTSLPDIQIHHRIKLKWRFTNCERKICVSFIFVIAEQKKKLLNIRLTNIDDIYETTGVNASDMSTNIRGVFRSMKAIRTIESGLLSTLEFHVIPKIVFPAKNAVAIVARKFRSTWVFEAVGNFSPLASPVDLKIGRSFVAQKFVWNHTKKSPAQLIQKWMNYFISHRGGSLLIFRK